MHSRTPRHQVKSLAPRVRTSAVFILYYSLLSVCLVGCGAVITTTSENSGSLSIASQPTDVTIVASRSATFSVVASGATPIRYQWQRNGSPISGATQASYTTPATTSSDNGAHFGVRVTDSNGTIASRSAKLTVTAQGQISATPLSLSFGNVPVGTSITRQITVVASGSSDVTFTKIGVAGAGFDVSGASTGLMQAPGQTTTLAVTFTPAASGSVTGSVSLTSDASNPLTTIHLSGSGVEPAAHSVSMTMAIPAPADIVGYNVYRASIRGGPYAKLTQSVSKTSTFTDVTVQAGDTYYYVATSVDSSNTESEPSDEASATIPLD
jgi:hypothetical protein